MRVSGADSRYRPGTKLRIGSMLVPVLQMGIQLNKGECDGSREGCKCLQRVPEKERVGLVWRELGLAGVG